MRWQDDAGMCGDAGGVCVIERGEGPSICTTRGSDQGRLNVWVCGRLTAVEHAVHYTYGLVWGLRGSLSVGSVVRVYARGASGHC